MITEGCGSYSSWEFYIKNKIKMKISNREKKVLHLIAYEHTEAEIATKIFISPHTVHTHRKKLLVKLNAKNTAGMVRVANEKGYFLKSLCIVLIAFLSSNISAQIFQVETGSSILDGGYHRIGRTSNSHISMDVNQIQASYGSSPVAISINHAGGPVAIGGANHILPANGNTAIPLRK